MTCLRFHLSQTSKAKDNYINGLALDITGKTYYVQLLLEGQLIREIVEKKKLKFKASLKI